MRTFRPEDIHRSEVHKILLSGVAPRPVALVGSVDTEGRPNLSPFSFFNAFSSNPPVVAFSPSYRGTDGTAKDTFRNVKATGECTISAVTYSMVEQISLASSNYEPGIDEFIKAGLTKLASRDVQAPGVAESPFVMECSLLHHYEVAEGEPGSGNIMICRVVRFHVRDSVFVDDVVDPQRMDLVARMGYNFYCRASGKAVFEVAKPRWNGIGFDALPEAIRSSTVLRGNDLAKLAGVEYKPVRDTEFPPVAENREQPDDFETELASGAALRALYALVRRPNSEYAAAQHIANFHRVAALFLDQGRVEEAWQTLLLAHTEIR